VSEYLLVVIATLTAALPLIVALAYRIGYNRALRRMAENRRWEHWLIRNESNRSVRF